MTPRILSCVLALVLAGCGSGGPTVTDGSGNPVHIGNAPANAGPGSPGWPREPAVSGR